MQMLIDDHIEKEVKFLGVVRNVPIDFDPTNRTDVLLVIDRGKREKCLARIQRPENDSIFSMNAFNIKVSSRLNKEDILLRLPIHQVAAVSYIREEDQHILAVKFGDLDLYKTQGSSLEDNQTCHLAVLCCDSRTTAEELCSLVDQHFQTVYTEATMHLFDRNLLEKARSLNSNPNILSPRTNLRKSAQDIELGFLSHSAFNVGTIETLLSMTSRTMSIAARMDSEEELSAAASELILDYMKKLYSKLNTGELQRFAMLVKAWHTDLPFADFCDEVHNLYGPDRRHLLLGMRPFIPSKDSAYFERFLDKLGLNNKCAPFFSGPGIENRQSMLGLISRSPSQSTTSGIDSYDEELFQGIDQLGSTPPSQRL